MSLSILYREVWPDSSNDFGEEGLEMEAFETIYKDNAYIPEVMAAAALAEQTKAQNGMFVKLGYLFLLSSSYS